MATEVAARPRGQTITYEVESPTRRALRRFVRHRIALIGLGIIAVIVLLAIFSDERAALQQNLRLGLTNQPPA